MRPSLHTFLAALGLTLSAWTPVTAQAADLVVDSVQSTVTLTGSDHLTLLPGAQVSWLDANGQSSVDMSGGAVSWLRVQDQAVVNITGAEAISWLVIKGDVARVNIAASNVSYSQGHLSGTWANGQTFSFWALRDEVLSSSSAMMSDAIQVMPINIAITAAVPEPGTWALMGLGLCGVGSAVRRRSQA